MPAKVALGWSTKNAFAAPTGKILVTDYIWTRDNTVGQPGWGRNATITTRSEAMLAPAIPWIGDGKRYLALQRTPHVDGDSFGTYFAAYVVAAGGTFTRSGASGKFNGLDWNNYDVICAEATADAGEASTFDAAIAAGKSAMVCVQPYLNNFARYGINREGYQTANEGAPNYGSYPFTCAPLGLVAHQVLIYSSMRLIDGTNTMGGTYTRYNSTIGEGIVGIWTP